MTSDQITEKIIHHELTPFCTIY